MMNMDPIAPPALLKTLRCEEKHKNKEEKEKRKGDGELETSRSLSNSTVRDHRLTTQRGW